MSATADSPGLVYPYPAPMLRATIKQRVEDFEVTEHLGFTPCGEGEHLYLYVQKTGLTTQQLIEDLSREVGIRPRDVGYSGLKDKQALTRQWLSLHLPGRRQQPQFDDSGSYRILDAAWHEKKLRVGTHKSNRFRVLLRDVQGDFSHVEAQLERITRQGFANYFGEQRFGRQRDNVLQALRVLNHRHKRKRLSRSRKSLMISALRSEMFNRILSQRIARGIWQQPVAGDAFMLAGSQSFFRETLSDELVRRYRERDIHSAVSLFGSGDSALTDQAREIEEMVSQQQAEIRDTLLQLDVKRSMRANRALVAGLDVRIHEQERQIEVEVELSRGVFMTTLLNHFVRLSESG